MLALTLLLTTALSPVAAPGGGEWRLPLGDLASVRDRFDPGAGRFGAGHRGVDLAGAVGDEVRAAGDGTVSFASLLAGRGVLVVSHGRLRTTYEPVQALVVPGDVVAAGEVIGRLRSGHLRCLPDPCLHWGLRRGEDYLDPLSLVGAGRVRLLPLTRGGAADLAVRAPIPRPRVALRPSPGPGAGPPLDSPRPSGQPPELLALGVVAAGASAGWAWRRSWPG